MNLAPSRPSARLPRTIGVLALGAAILAACQLPGDTPGSLVEQLNRMSGPSKVLGYAFHEGTGMAAAPSPDGKRIAFSAQGALWVMPASGGSALRITNWRAEPARPVWSPDGQSIAFQNFTPEGNYHIWTVAPDGRRLKEHTGGPYDDREPAWLPDGSGLVFSSDRGGDGQYKIWLVNLATHRLSQITHGPGAESDPAVSPDGHRLAYVDGAGIMLLALDGNGAPRPVAPGAVPAWTPDGTGLVYQNAARQLVVGGVALGSGEDLFAFPVRFLPDGRFLYTADGKIRTRDAAGARLAEIAFSAELSFRRPELVKPKARHFNQFGPRAVMGISAPAISPDAKSVAFVALNDVWIMNFGQAPVRLTQDSDRDSNPQWTPDGRAVYFSSERDNGGQLAIDQINVATMLRTRLAAIAGRSMLKPKMSPSGDRIAYTTAAGQLEIWTLASSTYEVIAASAGGQVSTPQWTADGQHIVVVDNERINNRFPEGYNKLRVIDLNTHAARFVDVAAPPRQISERDEGAAALAPDGTRIAFIMDSLLYIMRLNPDGTAAGPALRLSSEAADLPSWSGDSTTILYKSGNQLKTVQAEGGGPREIPLNLQWSQAVPAGSTLIHAGALWDGLGAELRHDVDILVTRNRIAWVRPHQASTHAAYGQVVDASALTVMPGMIDAQLHAHTLFQGGQVGQSAALMLAYGLTSVQSAAGPLHRSVELREALEAGSLTGPRLFTAPPLWEGNRLSDSFARALRTPEVADLEIAKAQAMDVDFMQASLRTPIPVMARIAQGALAFGVASASGSIQPGAASGLWGARMGQGGSVIYQDVCDLYGKTDFHLADTLFPASALAGLDPAIAGGERFVLVAPDFIAGLQNAQAPSGAQMAAIVNQAAQQAKVHKAGGLVANGTDSPLAVPGISLHLNLRAAALAMGNVAALQTVTLNAARIGLLGRELGSVEPGKLADLIAVRGNPLQDIGAAANVELVMKNGLLFTQAQILAPFRSAKALAARHRDVGAYNADCPQNAAGCGDAHW